MSENVTKVFQPHADGPDDTILAERTPDPDHFYVYHNDSDGKTVGRAEVTPAYVRTGGTFDTDDSNPLITWMVGPHLTGHKYKMEYRVRANVLADAVHIIREQQKIPTRRGVTGYDWRETTRWEIDHIDVREVDG
jgi:hypothetical protein